MGSNWDWQVFLQDPGGDYPTYLQWMLSAWGWTVSVALLALVIALVAGSVIGTLRTLPDNRFLVGFGNAWVELFRNIPLLVQIFLWYHVVPAIFPVMKSVSGFILVVLALGFFTSARIAEQVRSGIQALPRGQRYAGMALGFTTVQYYRYVLLPMAFRIILPPLTSETMNIFKNSSVAFAVSVTELTMFAMQAQEETSRGIEIYLAVTGLYVVSAFAINRIMAFIEKRARVPGFIVAGGTGGGH
ncbi:amino acid ABC transporter permease [Paracidovorax citrulli]|uniref:Amino acid ABC transporter membrane protein 1, PAAT family n=3 Tax=Pseudomonadota TaxID=1224 RepID=A1TUH5_PARC0|nr:amino acid ABC transporter permease [Paracidovorax citrulli]ABM34613.1 amino acid ABC transporter membrane protein 1, PAAT family [Paracidovorax citrulli AAC00-1]ATG94056.1 amino acid ABC transporter permease [Paracidovorax citrulli]PVY64052.1 amino acid ABC transporter membrane protein 1 (PAAT family) [Paracidovorax citrulli]QCX10026.1 putative glutamine ABC transporter permease protein GlnM [Paracidovorax citrulli]REG66986.1 amino acid ABC transporter membrane protein 1 (PAAT family) [Par